MDDSRNYLKIEFVQRADPGYDFHYVDPGIALAQQCRDSEVSMKSNVKGLTIDDLSRLLTKTGQLFALIGKIEPHADAEVTFVFPDPEGNDDEAKDDKTS